MPPKHSNRTKILPFKAAFDGTLIFTDPLVLIEHFFCDGDQGKVCFEIRISKNILQQYMKHSFTLEAKGKDLLNMIRKGLKFQELTKATEL